ncbi:MAG: hypothetical protein ACYDGW_01345 [Vulcanimicrobiaceae bacterium]
MDILRRSSPPKQAVFFSGVSSVSFSLSQAGFPGVITLVLGLALALLPFYRERIAFANRELIVYGIACALFGTLAALWLASLSLPVFVSAIGGLSLGFYALIVGFAFNVFATAKSLKER